jgi:N-ethylmaleimide reductase
MFDRLLLSSARRGRISTAMNQLLSPLRLGRLQLPNRVVMAPMTRSRAIGSVPNDLMARYYAARSSAGLLITEGIAPSPSGLGYARIPGLFDAAQIEGWRRVTEGVHAAGGRIVAQLMHVGRIAHALNLPPQARVVAPSAVAAQGQMYTDQQGPQPLPLPEALDAAGLVATREEFVTAARNAITAGFDGVELHAANGYLLEQFLNPASNRRTDEWGGSAEKRIRFVKETALEVADAIGADRTAIRFSPWGTFNDMPVFDEVTAQYTALASALRGLLYVHLVGNAHPEYPTTEEAIRASFGGPLVLNGGFEAESAATAIQTGRASLVSFGRPFIANPDLVRRFEQGLPLAPPRPELFYTPGAEGYVEAL